VSRRLVVWVLAAVVVLVALVPVGRWERARRARHEVRGMSRVLHEVGPLDSRPLDAFRHLFTFDCLLYKRGSNPFALELCVDHQGRLIEAIDRRSGRPHIWSLRDDPTRSTIHVDYAEFQRLLHRVGAPH
jgi:hypothetical protein